MKKKGKGGKGKEKSEADSEKGHEGREKGKRDGKRGRENEKKKHKNLTKNSYQKCFKKISGGP